MWPKEARVNTVQCRMELIVSACAFCSFCTFYSGGSLAQSSSNDPNETSREGVVARQGDVSAAGKRRPSITGEWSYKERGWHYEGTHEILVG